MADLPAPLAAYKFTVRVVEHGADAPPPRRIGVMSVNGLRSTKHCGELLIAKGIAPGHEPYFHSWFRQRMGSLPSHDNDNARDIYIDVDEGIQFRVVNARPIEFAYTDLDAGGSNHHIMQEIIKFSYQEIEVTYP